MAMRGIVNHIILYSDIDNLHSNAKLIKYDSIHYLFNRFCRFLDNFYHSFYSIQKIKSKVLCYWNFPFDLWSSLGK